MRRLGILVHLLAVPVLPGFSHRPYVAAPSRPQCTPRALAARASAAPPVSALLFVCKDACDEIAELVQAVYTQLAREPDAAVSKADRSFFSLADGVVQALLTRLLKGIVGGIVSEEDDGTIDISGAPPYYAGTIVAPAEYEPLIIRLRERMDALAARVPRSAEYASLTAFIDPIDGTREFCTGLGEQCSICIGLADSATGASLGGLVYRPLCESRSWALGCKREGVAESVLRRSADGARAGSKRKREPGSFLCSNGEISNYLDALQRQMGYEARRAGGAGNKALLLLECGPAACYIQDRGTSRWDTCAAQAVVEAHGGSFARLDLVVNAASDEDPLKSYVYVEGEINSDFVPGLARLSKYNAREDSLRDAAADEGQAVQHQYARDVDEVRPYANLCGIFALAPCSDADAITKVRELARETAQATAPRFD